MSTIKKINHVAIAVPNLDEAINFWSGCLGIAVDHKENVTAQKSEVAFLPVGDSEIELVCPTTEDSGVARFVKERGGGMHHLCLEVDNLVEAITEMKNKGIKLINESPLEMEGRKLAFIHPKSTGGVLIELYELIS